MDGNFSGPEWNADDWQSAWSINVGKTYKCSVCGNLIIVVRGGTGTLEPRCHDKMMESVGGEG